LHLGGSARPWADERELLDGLGERERAVVLEKDEALDGDLISQVLRVWRVDIGPRELAVRLRRGGVKVPEAEK
jgi:hypothetical protein